MTRQEIWEEVRGVLGTAQTKGRCVLNVSDVDWLTTLTEMLEERCQVCGRLLPSHTEEEKWRCFDNFGSNAIDSVTGHR